MARFKTVNDICNQIAVEVGLTAQSDIFATTDAAFKQLIALSNAVGYELLQDAAWQGLVRSHQIITQDTDTGKYPLPDDFSYMINQTHWDRTNNVAVGGPLSAQEWTYLIGRDLVSQTIYATFREVEQEFWLFPQPPPEGLDVNFEYISTNWVLVNGLDGSFDDKVANPADVILYQSHLFERLLKLRFLEARGFDTSVAATQYDTAMISWSGKDKGAPVLNAGARYSGIPYLDGLHNTPDTNYGL